MNVCWTESAPADLRAIEAQLARHAPALAQGPVSLSIAGCRRIAMHYKIPLVLEPQPEGGFTVTSPLIPELITEGDTLDDSLENVRDALAAVLEVYRETRKALPPSLTVPDSESSVSTEVVISVP